MSPKYVKLDGEILLNEYSNYENENDYIIKIDDIKYKPKNSEELYNVLLWGRD